MAIHSLRVVSSVLDALKTAVTTLAITWLGIAMAMAIAIPVSFMRKVKDKS